MERVGARVKSDVVCELPARGTSEEIRERRWRVCLLRLERCKESGGMMPFCTTSVVKSVAVNARLTLEICLLSRRNDDLRVERW